MRCPRRRAQSFFKDLRGIGAPADDRAGKQTAKYQKDNADGQWPALARQGVRDVNHVLWKHTQEQGVVQSQQVDRIEDCGDCLLYTSRCV